MKAKVFYKGHWRECTIVDQKQDKFKVVIDGKSRPTFWFTNNELHRNWILENEK